MSLNAEQQFAVESMAQFLKTPNQSFYLLKGSAGTGKTYCMKHLAELVKGRLIFTAPTNKATKVLRDSMTTESYRPQCKTIYSLLGLRLEANGEVKELAHPEEEVDLTQFAAVVVDEASMVNAVLWNFIQEVSETQGVKFIFMGDPAQIPPVGEERSVIWDKCDVVCELSKVMRYDNQILKLATHLRSQVDHHTPSFKRAIDNDGTEGVWVLPSSTFEAAIIDYARDDKFSEKNCAKVIAWRNATVDSYNKLVRSYIFDNAHECPWLVGDRLILMQPAKDVEDKPIASTDDEGTVTRVIDGFHHSYREFQVRYLSVTLDENRPITLCVLHENSASAFARYEKSLAEEARLDRRKWKAFWQFKESFHTVRHAYAVTSHRAQGSTYESVFVDWRDILLNRNRQEAFRCLYVACTRAKKQLMLGA